MLNDKEAMQIAQKVDAIEIVPNHEIMAQEQASNLSENIPEEETHRNHSEGLATVTSVIKWQPPREGFYKVNTYAALNVSWQRVGVGLVVRDANKDVMAASAQRLEATYTPN
ncbi:hypothetical protein LWI29_028113 [Acer saccharum]|uniref:Uncharacterized protein n=1 Tax=Acer saccharum TaxID=4024 RepID=A0AA39RVI8_ACESA|nr:hypothetical protein LWI29_028113 [Acer saccharum]